MLKLIGDDDISQKLAACQEQFGTIVKHCSTLENVTAKELVDCVTKVPQKPQYETFLKVSSSLAQCTTVVEFIGTLCDMYSNFLFYQLFEKVVITYGNEILRRDMKQYKERLTSITTIAKATEYIQSDTRLHSTEVSAEIVIDICIPFLDCRISDIERVRNELRNISYMFELCHNIVDISGDSTTTTTRWSFPRVFCRHLQVDVLLSSIPWKSLLGNISASALEMCGVQTMYIDGLCVFEYDPHNKEVGTNY